MKYLKNIHEHKNNISVVSKKLILGMVFLFGMSFTADANVVVSMDYETCDTMAHWLGYLYGLSYEAEYELFNACMSI